MLTAIIAPKIATMPIILPPKIEAKTRLVSFSLNRASFFMGAKINAKDFITESLLLRRRKQRHAPAQAKRTDNKTKTRGQRPRVLVAKESYSNAAGSMIQPLLRTFRTKSRPIDWRRLLNK